MSALHLPPHVRAGRRVGRPGGFATYGTALGGVAAGGRWPLDLVGIKRFFDPGELLAFWELWNPSIVAYLDGPGEQLINGGFEAGVPPGLPTNWTSTGGATVTLVAASPYEGLQNVRVVGPALAAANQSAILTVGVPYFAWGRYRTDGVEIAEVNLGTNLATLGSAAVWTYGSATGVAGGGFFRLQKQSAGGGWVEFDDWHIVELPGIHTVPNLLSPGTYDLTQTVYADMPWLHPKAWLGAHPAAQFNGTSHHLVSDLLAGQFAGTDQPLFAIIPYVEFSGVNGYVLSLDGAAANPNRRWVMGAVGRHTWFNVDNVGTSATVTGVAGDMDPVEHCLALMYTGTRITLWRDEVVVTGFNDVLTDVALSSFNRLTLFAARPAGVLTWPAPTRSREALIGRATNPSQILAASRLMRSRSYI